MAKNHTFIVSNKKVTIQIGGAGNAFGTVFWEQILNEHNISKDGIKQINKSDQNTAENINAFFKEYIHACLF